MITLTKIDGNLIVINADEIETVETLHDTFVCLKSSKRIFVQESYHEIIEAVIEYRRLCNNKLPDNIK